MGLSLEKLDAELRSHHNEVCLLYGSEIVRLIGVHECDCDFYYTVEAIRSGAWGARVVHSSAVGHIDSLKGILPEAHYVAADSYLKANGSHGTPEFSVTRQKDSCCFSPHLAPPPAQ